MEHTLAGILWRLAGVLALVFANGFCVASEFAIVTLRKTRIDQLIAEGSRSAVTGLLGIHPAEGHSMVHSEEELKMLVTASQEAGVLEEQEEQMLHRVFDFADLTAGQAMVPRTELIAIAADASGDALVEQISR